MKVIRGWFYRGGHRVCDLRSHAHAGSEIRQCRRAVRPDAINQNTSALRQVAVALRGMP